MIRTIRTAVLATLVATVAAPALAQGMRSDDWYRLNRVSDVQFAPDGRSLLYVVTRANRATQRHDSQVWLVAADGRSDPRLFVTDFASSSQPRFSTDGTRVAFVGSRATGERAQIYVASATGGSATRVTDVETPLVSYVWSPDGRRFAVVSRVGPRVDADDPLSGVTVIRDLKFAQDGRGLLKNQRAHVFVVDIATGSMRQVTDGDFDHVDPAWSPDGRWLAYSADRTGQADNGGRNTDIYIVAADGGGSARKISPHNEANGSPAFSPDGKSIAFTGVAAEAGQSDIYTMPVEGGTPVNLTAAFDERIQRFVWTRHGIYFTTNMKGEVPLFKLDVSAKKVEPFAAQQGAQVTSFSLADDGAIAVTRSGFRHPTDVFVGAAGAAPNRHVIDVNRALLAERTLAAIEPVAYKADDGLDIQGWLVKPQPFDAARKYPLVLRIHGGPAGMYGTNFDHEVHTLTARGYAVLFINPRGSSGYGQAFVRANHKDWLGKDYSDLMKGVDVTLAKNPWIDPQRLAVYGCSYGGYMTNWIITQTTRFKAAVSECGMSNMVALWGSTDGARSPEEAFGGSPWETYDLWWGRSPLKFAGNVKTPTLFIHGEDDIRVPVGQAEAMFRALKRHGVETELVRYAGESHGEFANGKPAHYVDRIERVLRWFDRHGGE